MPGDNDDDDPTRISDPRVSLTPSAEPPKAGPDDVETRPDLAELVRFDRPAEKGPIRVSIGIRDKYVALCVGAVTLRLTANKAQQLGSDLVRYALELRTGGVLP
jgi:hypothetical protein